MSKNTWGFLFKWNFILSPFSLGSQTSLRVNKLGPQGSGLYLRTRGNVARQLGGKGTPDLWCVLALVPTDQERDGKPLSGDLLPFGGLSTQLQKAIPNLTLGSYLGSLPCKFEKSLNAAAPMVLHYLEGNQRRCFRKPVFVQLNASCPTFIY